MFPKYAKWVAVAALAVAPAALAQTIVVDPTRGTGIDAYAKGETTASVQQQVQLIVPTATALHLDVTRLEFNLSPLDGPFWGTRVAGGTNPTNQMDRGIVCAYVYGDDQAGPAIDGKPTVFPGGVGYAVTTYPRIALNGPDGQPSPTLVTTYPPLRVDANGEMIPGSKNYFVCFKTFELQMFSNGSDWNLAVNRADQNTDWSIDNLYLQANLCNKVGGETPFYALPNHTSNLNLIPDALSYGPTGKAAATAPTSCDANKSWLDALMVVAVKIDGDKAGTNMADLTYTLTTIPWAAPVTVK